MKALLNIGVLLLICITGCSSETSLPPGEPGRVIRSGEFLDRAEEERRSFNNCQGQAEIKQSASRSYTLNDSVQFDIEGGLELGLREVLKAQIGAEYHWTEGTAKTYATEFQLVFPAGTHYSYVISWHEKWETGYVEWISRDGRVEQIAYEYLTDSVPEGCATVISCDGNSSAVEQIPVAPSPTPGLGGNEASMKPPDILLPNSSSAIPSNLSEDMRVLYMSGLQSYDDNDFAATVNSMSQVLQSEPGHYMAYVYRGAAYYELGSYDLARMDYEEAVVLRPEDYIVQNNLGVIYVRLGKFRQSATAYDAAVALNPECGFCYYNRGLLYHESDCLRAEQDYSKALTFEPDLEMVFYYRALIYLRLGQIDAARRDFQQYLRFTDIPSHYRAEAEMKLQQLEP